jgi:hypothetical protein
MVGCIVNDELERMGKEAVVVLSEVLIMDVEDRGSTVVKVQRYKSEGRWFDPKWCHGIFHRHKSF